jgi:hypothetical protein
MFEVFGIVQTQGLKVILKWNLSVGNLNCVSQLTKTWSFSLLIRISLLRYPFRLRINFCAFLKATIRLRKISIKITISDESAFGLKVSEGCDLTTKRLACSPPRRCNKTFKTVPLPLCYIYCGNSRFCTLHSQVADV